MDQSLQIFFNTSWKAQWKTSLHYKEDISVMKEEIRQIKLLIYASPFSLQCHGDCSGISLAEVKQTVLLSGLSTYFEPKSSVNLNTLFLYLTIWAQYGHMGYVVCPSSLTRS